MGFPPLTWKETCPGGAEFYKSDASPPAQPLERRFRPAPSPGCALSARSRSSPGRGEPCRHRRPAQPAPAGCKSRVPRDAAQLRLRSAPHGRTTLPYIGTRS